jgi:hypothetical protein
MQNDSIGLDNFPNIIQSKQGDDVQKAGVVNWNRRICRSAYHLQPKKGNPQNYEVFQMQFYVDIQLQPSFQSALVK